MEEFKREHDDCLARYHEAYRRLLSAADGEQQILREMDEALAREADREKAEKIVLQKYGPMMDEAMKASREAFDEWMAIGREEMRKE